MEQRRRNFLIGSALFSAALTGALLPSACAVWNFERMRTTPKGEKPARPRGKAKPMLEEDIGPVLARLDAWYAANLPSDKYVFNPPATDEALAAFERAVGRKMPSSYHQLYRWHDGENDDRWGHIYGLPILPLSRAAADHDQWKRTLASIGGNPYLIPGGSWPEGAVDPAYANSAWIPLTNDGSSNCIGLDFDPWPTGRVGQVIIFGRDEDVKVVLAESLGKFLSWIADLLESGNFRLESDRNENVLRTFRLKLPPVDHFHEGARRLLGAPGQFL